MLYKNLLLVILVLTSVVSVSTLAKGDFDKDLSPLNAAFALQHTDNYNPLALDSLSATGIKAELQGNLVTVSESIWLQGDYELGQHKFSLEDSEVEMQDSFQNIRLGIDSRFFFASKWSVDLATSYHKQDELLGTGLSRLRMNVTNQDSYTATGFSAELNYGSELSTRMLKLGARRIERDYESNNEYADSFDLSQSVYDILFNYRVSDFTRLIAFAELRELKYDSATDLDSSISKAMLGVHWKASGKSSLSAQIGMYQRSYDELDSSSGATWEIGAEYYMREDVIFQLNSSQASVAGDSELSTDTVERLLNVELSYLYSDVWRYGLQGHLIQSQYSEPTNDRTADQSNVAGFVELTLLSNQTLRLQVQSESLEDKQRSIDFSQNRIDLSWYYEL